MRYSHRGAATTAHRMKVLGVIVGVKIVAIGAVLLLLQANLGIGAALLALHGIAATALVVYWLRRRKPREHEHQPDRGGHGHREAERHHRRSHP